MIGQTRYRYHLSFMRNRERIGTHANIQEKHKDVLKIKIQVFGYPLQ